MVWNDVLRWQLILCGFLWDTVAGSIESWQVLAGLTSHSFDFHKMTGRKRKPEEARWLDQIVFVFTLTKVTKATNTKYLLK